MKIAIITGTGSYAADQIFIGVFGTLDQGGNFHVAEELKSIHLFNLITPELLAQQGINLSQNVAEIEIEEAAAPGFKAGLMTGLRKTWLSTYDSSNTAPGLARAALAAERDQVDRAITEAIAKIGNPTTVLISTRIQNVDISDEYRRDRDDDLEWSEVPAGITAWNATLVQEIKWALHQTAVDIEALPSTSPVHAAGASLVSGTVVGQVVIHGSIENSAAIVDAMNAIPASLRKVFSLGSDARFLEVKLHAERLQATDTVEALPAPRIPVVEGFDGDDGVDLHEAAAAAAPQP